MRISNVVAYVGLYLAVSGEASACDLAHARYVYTGSDAVKARFLSSDKLSSGWLSKNYIEIDVGRKHVYLLFDRGAARQVFLISSENPQTANPPTPDGGIRPYGSMTYVAWGKNNKVENDIPRDVAPDFFLIPELADRLARPPDPVSFDLGIFELQCAL